MSATLAEVLADLDRQFPGFRFRVIDEQGRVRQYIILFVGGERQEDLTAAIPAGDPLLHDWVAEAARGDAVVVGGFCELGADGHLYNSSALVDGEGVQAIYRKVHLWDEEKRWFRPPPQTTAVFSNARKPGVVLRVSMI